MKIVNGKDFRKLLVNQIRVYLCGKLTQAEHLKYVETDGLEIGISHYDSYTAEKAHYHDWNYEYNFVIKGSVKVFVFDENKEYEFHQDDLYVIEPHMAYITKAQADTEVLFVKSPGGNDKKLVSVTEVIENWCKEWNSQMK